MTNFSDIFDRFERKIVSIEWGTDLEESELEEEKAEDYKYLLLSALASFGYARFEPDKRSDTAFDNDLTDLEQEICATLMKVKWLSRKVADWRNIELQYHTKDFELSNQANHLRQLMNLLSLTEGEAYNLKKIYSRTRDYKARNYSGFAGKKV